MRNPATDKPTKRKNTQEWLYAEKEQEKETDEKRKWQVKHDPQGPNLQNKTGNN